MESLSRAISAAREWELGQTSTTPLKPTKPPATPPASDSIILRTDAAWRVVSLTAWLGWIISIQEDTLQFTQLVLQVHSPLMGEALAMRAGLAKCKELGFQNIRCESDSKLLINSINHGNSLPELYGAVTDILCTATVFNSVSFVWISRDKNMAADLLAKQCLSVGVEVSTPP